MAWLNKRGTHDIESVIMMKPKVIENSDTVCFALLDQLQRLTRRDCTLLTGFWSVCRVIEQACMKMCA